MDTEFTPPDSITAAHIQPGSGSPTKNVCAVGCTNIQCTRRWQASLHLCYANRCARSAPIPAWRRSSPQPRYPNSSPSSTCSAQSPAGPATAGNQRLHTAPLDRCDGEAPAPALCSPKPSPAPRAPVSLQASPARQFSEHRTRRWIAASALSITPHEASQSPAIFPVIDS